MSYYQSIDGRTFASLEDARYNGAHTVTRHWVTGYNFASFDPVPAPPPVVYQERNLAITNMFPPSTYEPKIITPLETQFSTKLEEMVEKAGGWGWAILKAVRWFGLAIVQAVLPEFVFEGFKWSFKKIKEMFHALKKYVQ
jgi:hypothetical protein